jgi:putative toxin-antitoxin system antitoxin component (TIGR02293 family)
LKVEKKNYKKNMAKSIVTEALVAYKIESPLRVILGGISTTNKSLTNDYDLINLSRDGIKKISLKSLASFMGITMETMSSLVHTSYRNIQRKDDDELLDTLKTEKVLELAAFTQRGIDVIGSNEGFKEWLRSPIPALNNNTPLAFLDTTFGINIVTKLLGRLEQGVYS